MMVGNVPPRTDPSVLVIADGPLESYWSTTPREFVTRRTGEFGSPDVLVALCSLVVPVAGDEATDDSVVRECLETLHTYDEHEAMKRVHHVLHLVPVLTRRLSDLGGRRTIVLCPRVRVEVGWNDPSTLVQPTIDTPRPELSDHVQAALDQLAGGVGMLRLDGPLLTASERETHLGSDAAVGVGPPGDALRSWLSPWGVQLPEHPSDRGQLSGGVSAATSNSRGFACSGQSGSVAFAVLPVTVRMATIAYPGSPARWGIEGDAEALNDLVDWARAFHAQSPRRRPVPQPPTWEPSDRDWTVAFDDQDPSDTSNAWLFVKDIAWVRLPIKPGKLMLALIRNRNKWIEFGDAVQAAGMLEEEAREGVVKEWIYAIRIALRSSEIGYSKSDAEQTIQMRRRPKEKLAKYRLKD